MRTATRRMTTRLGAAGTASLIFLLLMIVLAVAGQWLAPYGPESGSILDAYTSPTGAHWLGTDANGFDILSRLIVGARTSLLGPAGVILISLVVGIPPALAAAWRGGLVDTAVSRVADILFAVPGLLLAVLAVAVFGPGLTPAVLAIAVSYLPYVARIARTAALQQRAQPYVAALEVQGASGFTICTRHILPNIAGIVLAQATLAFGYALGDLAALSFLGLAVQAPQADWGVLVNDESGLRNGHSVQVVAASVLIIATIAAITLLGDRLAGEDAAMLNRRTPRRKHRKVADGLPATEAPDTDMAVSIEVAI